MAGGGVAFSQALENQGNTNSSEPVIKYGTGGRITHGVRRFDVGGDASWGTISNADYGGDSGPGDFGYSGSYGGDGGAYDLGINPETGAVRMEFTGMAPPDYDGTGGVSDFGSLDSGPGANNINDIFDYNREGATPDGAYIDNTTGQVFDPNDNVPEIVITTDRPDVTGNGIDSLDIFNPNDILVTDFVTEGSDVPEIIITTDRPTTPPVTETDADDISEIIITTDRPTRPPVTETDTDDVSEIIITTDRPTKPPVTETDTDTDTITNTVTETETDTDTVTETETETETDTIFRTDPPTYTPRPTLPPVTNTPLPTNTPAPRQDIYRSQYQNYADPLTMFNVSNYGTDPQTSAGYNFATGPQGMGIDQLNQNLRDMANQQMAQTYPNGLPRGADMNAVLAAMRQSGLTATDLENARYGRTTGLNTPFSQYNKTAPTARTFGGGIAELIKNLPK